MILFAIEKLGYEGRDMQLWMQRFPKADFRVRLLLSMLLDAGRFTYHRWTISGVLVQRGKDAPICRTQVIGWRFSVQFPTLAAHYSVYIVDYAITTADISPAHALTSGVARMQFNACRVEGILTHEVAHLWSGPH